MQNVEDFLSIYIKDHRRGSLFGYFHSIFDVNRGYYRKGKYIIGIMVTAIHNGNSTAYRYNDLCGVPVRNFPLVCVYHWFLRIAWLVSSNMSGKLNRELITFMLYSYDSNGKLKFFKPKIIKSRHYKKLGLVCLIYHYIGSFMTQQYYHKIGNLGVLIFTDDMSRDLKSKHPDKFSNIENTYELNQRVIELFRKIEEKNELELYFKERKKEPLTQVIKHGIMS
jgi:hypothetical protein